MDVGLLVKERPSIPAPAKRVKTIRVAGRDGDLVINEGLYDPIVIPVKFNFMSKKPDDWMESFRKAKEWLTGQGNLWFSDDPEWFFTARYVQITGTERTSRRLGNFTAEFFCEPYMYSRAGDVVAELTDGKIYNPYMTAHPTYYIVGSGTGTLTVNGKTVQFTSQGGAYVSGTITINTETMRTIRYGEPANKAMTGRYEDLYLLPGVNTVSISSGFTLQIVPHWRTI